MRYDKLRTLVAQKSDKRTKAYKKRIQKLNDREFKLCNGPIFRSQTTMVPNYYPQSTEIKRIRNSDDYVSYLREKIEKGSQVKPMNIKRVKDQLIAQNIPLNRLIFLAHDRIDRFSEIFESTPFCHVYGHRHGFTSSYLAIRGKPGTGKTNYANISSLDMHYFKKRGYISPPNYVVMQLNGDKRIISEAVYLDVRHLTLPTEDHAQKKSRRMIEELYIYLEKVQKGPIEECHKLIQDYLIKRKKERMQL